MKIQLKILAADGEELQRCLIMLMRLSLKGFCNLRRGKDCSKTQYSVFVKRIHQAWNLSLHIMISLSLRSPLVGGTQQRWVNTEGWEYLAEIWMRSQTHVSVISLSSPLRFLPQPHCYYFAYNTPVVNSSKNQRICLIVWHNQPKFCGIVSALA